MVKIMKINLAEDVASSFIVINLAAGDAEEKVLNLSDDFSPNFFVSAWDLFQRREWRHVCLIWRSFNFFRLSGLKKTFFQETKTTTTTTIAFKVSSSFISNRFAIDKILVFQQKWFIITA